jgi:peptidoglycan/LPS O-acetylase OafA/YrhL
MVNLSGNGLGLIRIFLELAPFFLAGAVMHAARHVIIVSPWLFLASLGAILLAGWLGWAKPLAPLPLAYGAIWLGIKMPRVIERVRGGTIDISYGTYIYGYPVLVLAGLPQFGVPAMFVGSIAATAVPASLSWFFIEKPCLRLKNTRWPFRFP